MDAVLAAWPADRWGDIADRTHHRELDSVVAREEVDRPCVDGEQLCGVRIRDYQHLISLLVVERADRRLTQLDIAERAQVNPATISNAFTGKFEMRGFNLFRVVDAMGLQLALVTGENTPLRGDVVHIGTPSGPLDIAHWDGTAYQCVVCPVRQATVIAARNHARIHLRRQP